MNKSTKHSNKISRHQVSQDKKDFQAFNDRVSEPTISYEQLLKELKRKSGVV